MQASPTEYKRQKKEPQVLKIPQKTLTQQSKKMQMHKDGNLKHLGTTGHNEKTKPKDYRYRPEQRFPT